MAFPLRSIPLLAAIVLCHTAPRAQDTGTRLETACIGFYNLENFFDTIDSPDTDDMEFLPTAAKQWNTERYTGKLQRLARVIGELGPGGVRVLGVAEVENRQVFEDLVRTPPLAERGYRVVHEDSPDRRGVDVGLLYDPRHFTLLSHRAYPLRNPGDPEFLTRDQLLVKGVLDGDTMHFIVAHWPSRRGGEKRSQPLRMLAGKLGRHIVDSVLTAEPGARIIYMGDLNDDPVDRSITTALGATGDRRLAQGTRLFNPMAELHGKGIGSLAWRDSWNLFDQIILSPALLNGGPGRFRFHAARIHNQPYLRQREGAFAGYPLRTFVGDTHMEGFSDHFPVFVVLVREVEASGERR